MFFHSHSWSDWEEQRPHYWEHARFKVRFCRKCPEKEYSLIYLHCPQKKIKGEYCHWCRRWGEEWEKRLVSIDKTCYDDVMKTTEKRRRGQPIDMESLRKAVDYRGKGLGTREIARAMKKDPKQVLRWFAYVDNNMVQV